MEGRRVKITKTPLIHGSGTGSRKCDCKGKTGTLIRVVKEDNHTIAFIRLDKGGRVGVPTDDLRIFKNREV